MTTSNAQRGFTLIELIMILVILGVLSATALPKFFDVSVFQERAFFDDTLSAIRFAQKLAVASNCNVRVYISANQYTLQRPGASDRSQCQSQSAADFTATVLLPGAGGTYSGSQSGISLSSASIIFNALGAANSDFVLTIGSGKQITIVKETGFVYDSSS